MDGTRMDGTRIDGTRMDGTRIDGTVGWNCGKADRTQKVQGKIDGKDRNAWRDCGKADRTRKADCTRKVATAVSDRKSVV